MRKSATTREGASKPRQAATSQPQRPQAKPSAYLQVPAQPRARSNSCSLMQQQDNGFSAWKVEQLTQEERTSRMMHTGKARLKLQTGMPVVEQVFVVGAPPNREPPDSYAFATSDAAFPADDPAAATAVATGPEPKVLFQYPLDAEVAVTGLWQFCFPDGHVPQRRIRRNARRIDASAAVAGDAATVAAANGLGTRLQARTHHHHRHHYHHARGASEESVALAQHAQPENTAVFLITGHSELRYGVCVYKEVVAYKTETYFVIEPLCFCVVSPVPFLNFHLDALCGILDLPRITELPCVPPTKLRELLADAQAAAEVQTPRPPCTPMSPCGPVVPPPPPLLLPSNSGSATPPPLPAAPGTELARIETQADVDLKKILLTLEQYRKLTVPEESEQLQFFIMTRPRPITVRRPAFEEESELLQAFGSAILFRILPTAVVLQLVAALLLEFKVVLVSPHKRLLSAAILSLMPLLRPFEYQSPVIPILHTSLLAYLEAPVPLLVGMTKQPVASTHTEGFYILNLNTCDIQCTKPLLPLPNQADLSVLSPPSFLFIFPNH